MKMISKMDNISMNVKIYFNYVVWLYINNNKNKTSKITKNNNKTR